MADSVILLAFRTLEDVVARAHFGPVEPDWGVRLALRCVAERKLGLPWHYSDFWASMGKPCELHEAELATTHRLTVLRGLLGYWYGKAGLEAPDPVQRGRWAARHDPVLDAGSGTVQLPCMCNRYTPGDRENVLKLFGARQYGEWNDGPSTVHPKEPGIVVINREGELVVEQMTWGFPVVLRGKSGQLLKPKPVNNARFDKLGGFWKRWASVPAQRCLLPTVRYAEAVGAAGMMTETWLSVAEQPIFAWAGLWRDSEEWGRCYTGVMTDNAPELSHIHDRSPVILLPDQWRTWLTAPLSELYQFDQPFPSAQMIVDATTALWARR